MVCIYIWFINLKFDNEPIQINPKKRKTMKKLMIAALLVATIGTSAFAADVKNLSYRVTTNFEAKFTGAKNVTWTESANFIKATFELNGETVEAYYSGDGESIGTSRKVEFKTLPLNAISKIKKSYGSYTAKEVIEFDRDGEKNYYVSLVDGDKQEILEVSFYGNVSSFRATK